MWSQGKIESIAIPEDTKVVWERERSESRAYNADTDGDNLWDGYDIGEKMGELTYGTNPLNKDTDGDVLNDGDEVITHHTNPLSNDTDMDGLSDYQELKENITYRLDYSDVEGNHHTEEITINAGNLSPLNPDSDGDGLTDGQEINGWRVMIAWQEKRKRGREGRIRGQKMAMARD